MTIITAHHHPDDDVLLKYAKGDYDTAFSLVLATHVSLCVKCQNSIALQQEVAGQILSEQEPAAMEISALDLIKREPEPVAAEAATAVQKDSLKFAIPVPALLGHYLGDALDKIKWQKLSPSIKQHVLKVGGKASARLIWMAPGKSVPAHGHHGEEVSLILAGGYYDGAQAYRRGDLHHCDHETPHVPTAMEDGPCLVLAAADAPLIFSGIIPRLLQPFYKI